MFKEGDRVIIHRPKNTSEIPYWLNEMDEFDGTIVTVRIAQSEYWSKFYGVNAFVPHETNYSFNSNWAELVQDTDEDIYKEDIFSIIE